jgi:hypothetical protein
MPKYIGIFVRHPAIKPQKTLIYVVLCWHLDAF